MTALVLTLALILDALAGEPRWLWSRLTHPAILMGRWVNALDHRLNSGPNRRIKGGVCLAALILPAIALGLLISALPYSVIFELILAAILLAQRSLVDHVRAVANALRLSTGDARRAVAMIVSRDTTDMDPPAITRSAIESAAENLSDGVIAPAFWFLIAGLPGVLVYKITNTADSMIGYRTDRYADFGWAAARFDDLLNYIPARLTCALIATSQLRWPARATWAAIASDARLHRSPNAGWPEAAMARILNLSLAGPRSYDGKLRDFPFVHPEGRKSGGPDDIDAAISTLWRVWGMILIAIALIAVA